MRRVTAIDRDRAVRKLSLLTGGITASSVALVGGFGLLAKHETDHKNELKAQRSALAAKGLSAQTALVGATAQNQPAPAAQTTTTSHVLAFSAPTTSSAGTMKQATVKPVNPTVKPVVKATLKPAATKAATTSTKAAPATAAKVQAAPQVQQAPVQQAPLQQQAPVQQAPVQQAPVQQQAPDPAPATQAPDPQPVQSSGS